MLYYCTTIFDGKHIMMHSHSEYKTVPPLHLEAFHRARGELSKAKLLTPKNEALLTQGAAYANGLALAISRLNDIGLTQGSQGQEIYEHLIRNAQHADGIALAMFPLMKVGVNLLSKTNPNTLINYTRLTQHLIDIADIRLIMIALDKANMLNQPSYDELLNIHAEHPCARSLSDGSNRLVDAGIFAQEYPFLIQHAGHDLTDLSSALIELHQAGLLNDENKVFLSDLLKQNILVDVFALDMVDLKQKGELDTTSRLQLFNDRITFAANAKKAVAQRKAEIAALADSKSPENEAFFRRLPSFFDGRSEEKKDIKRQVITIPANPGVFGGYSTVAPDDNNNRLTI